MRKRTRREEEEEEEVVFSFRDSMLPSEEKTRVVSDPHEDRQVPSTESLQTKNGGGGGRIECSKEASSEGRPTPAEDCGRERLKRYRKEMAGRVWIPEIWGQESLLKDWIDCAAFDGFLVPKGLTSAREALVEECQRTNSGPRLGIENVPVLNF